MTSTKTITPYLKVDGTGLRKHSLTLTECQYPFVKLLINWVKNPRKLLVIVSGGPGTGKSYVVKTCLDFLKTTQIRMSFTARSAAAIGGRTIHSTLNLHPDNRILKKLEKDLAGETDLRESVKKSRDIKYQFLCETIPNVVFVDEVSMINGWFMYWIIRFFMDRTDIPLLFICTGDPYQLNPVRSIHNLFSFTFSEKKYEVQKIHLKKNKRFSPEYEKIITRLCEFVDKNDEEGMFAFVCQHFKVVTNINRPLLMQADLAMAFLNENVKVYNTFYLKYKVSGQEIVIHEDLILKPNCLVFVTKNHCSKASNGTKLIFKYYNEKDDFIMCQDPKSNAHVPVYRDNDTGRYNLCLGFASTVHKYQGDTIDNAKIIINFNENKNLNLVYTALSRVKSMDQILGIQL